MWHGVPLGDPDATSDGHTPDIDGSRRNGKRSASPAAQSDGLGVPD
jgi:hypothetical protein